MKGTHEKWVGFAEIAGITGLPEANLRRWKKNFPKWLPSKTFGRAERFRPECIEIFQRIGELFSERKTRNEVELILNDESSPVIDVSFDTIEKTKEYKKENYVLERIAISLEKLAESQAAIAVQLSKKIERIEFDINYFKNQRLFFLEKSDFNKREVGDFQKNNDRETIINRVKELHFSGLGASAIASTLKRESFSTLSGRGTWGKGSVQRILKIQKLK